MMTCGEFAELLGRAAIKARNELDIPTEALMIEVQEKARNSLGTYQTGWDPLKPETIARKATGDSPLLETGEMRDSIDQRSELTGYGAEGVIFSDDMIAVYQELGTSRIPPRPFLSLALLESEPLISKLFGDFAVKLLTFG